MISGAATKLCFSFTALQFPSRDHIKNCFQVRAFKLLSVVVMVLHYKAAAYFEERNGFALFFFSVHLLKLFFFQEKWTRYLIKKIKDRDHFKVQGDLLSVHYIVTSVHWHKLAVVARPWMLYCSEHMVSTTIQCRQFNHSWSVWLSLVIPKIDQEKLHSDALAGSFCFNPNFLGLSKKRSCAYQEVLVAFCSL